MKNIKYIYQSLLVLGVLFIGTISNTSAQPIPEQSNPPRLVVDAAGIFTSSQVQAMERELVAFSDTTSNQIVVVTMSDLEDYQPWEVAQNIGHKWGVGQDGFDNGIVILIKPKTRSSRGQINIQVGYGLEGAIPDATAKMIVENEIIPYFKNGDMFGGVESGIQIIKGLSVGEFNSDAYANSRSSSGGKFPGIFVFFIIIFVVLRIAGNARSYGRRNNLPFWIALGMMNSSSGHGGSYSNFTSGGGGFGGFGGGGFGGGGAGGSW